MTSRRFTPCQHCAAQFAQLTAQVEKFRQESLTDALTRLPNQRSFEERFAEEIARANRYKRPLVVCFADLDHFKVVNDTYGHHVGNRILVQFGKILSASLRKGDFVARMTSGDEFAIIFPETTKAHAKKLIERLKERVKKDLHVREGDKQARASASFGFEELRSEETESFHKRVDQALYREKARRPPSM